MRKRVIANRPLMTSLVTGVAAASALANPEGMTVTRGTVSALSLGSQLNLSASHNAVINWQSFNIRAGETTTFQQPSAASIVWNRILDQNPTQVFGHLNANGYVVLFNQNGFYFGPNSVVNVGGLLVSTAPVTMPDGGGGLWNFNGPPPVASIINYGEIKVRNGGSLFLVAEQIENHGVLSAPAGTLGLYAGKKLLVSESPDGRGISVNVELPEGSVDNTGKLIADAGTIALHARVVNQGGLIQADSARERNGVIELVASEEVKLGPNSVLQAKGDASNVSAGGNILVKSGQKFIDVAGSLIDVRGGAAGGNGGQVEVSAPEMATLNSQFLGSAQSGFAGARLTLDPTDIVLGTSGAGSAGSGTVNANDLPGTLQLDVNSAFVGFSQIKLQATRDIRLEQNTLWNLNDTTGVSGSDSLLMLEAGRNILFGDNARISSAGGWSVNLSAGMDFASHTIQPGAGSIYLNGGPADLNGLKPNFNGSIETADGSINLAAGLDLLVGSGFIRTTAGGNIDILTKSGDVDAGTKADGYQFTRQGYSVNPAGLGGIATANGGDLTIQSGRDVISFFGAAGAYGPGNVNVTAAERILGKYHFKDGHGSLHAGTDVGTDILPVSLSMIGRAWSDMAPVGSQPIWDVTANRDIFLNEVFNPNGAQNFNGTRLHGQTTTRTKFEFDYAADAAVKLTAGNSVQLIGDNLVHAINNENSSRPPVYPPQLEIHAGAGGVVLARDLVLYPSPLGRLQIETTDGGSLRSAPGTFNQLVMSDSGSLDYNTFATAHAAAPLQLASAGDPVTLNISGSLENIFLRSPKKAVMIVGGDTRNFTFEGQNLTADDVTSLKITGDYLSRSDRTFASSTSDPDFTIFDPTITLNGPLGARLTWNPATGKLSFQGKMTEAERDFLLHPQVKQLDVFGNTLVDGDGVPISFPASFTPDAAVIQKLYADSQDVPQNSLAYKGLQIGGPGEFRVAARNLDLGTSQGIRSVGTLFNDAISVISRRGADLKVDLAGDLALTASQIASFSGGNIALDSQGSVNVGSQEQFTSDDTPKGILTSSGGNVSVVSRGDINVNGSRIAAYDGGNVTVKSSEGDINAGEGGLGFVVIYRTKEDPVTHKTVISSSTIPGSGILATTLRDSTRELGDIYVEATQGSIVASKGGVLQLAFNGNNAGSPNIKLKAKHDIDSSNSGIIGGSVDLEAGGNITGLVVAKENINIKSDQSVSVTALAQQGSVSVSASSVSGTTAVGGGGVNVDAGSISSSTLVANSVNAKGDQTGVSSGVGTANVSGAQTKVTQETADTVAKKSDTEEESEQKKRLASAPALARTVSRVTVILPDKPTTK